MQAYLSIQLSERTCATGTGQRCGVGRGKQISFVSNRHLGQAPPLLGSCDFTAPARRLNFGAGTCCKGSSFHIQRDIEIPIT
jgi:hypothetical protein